MKVLILSNMYPSSQKPYAGIFVRNQVEWLERKGGDGLKISVCTMKRRFTGVVGTLWKYSAFFASLIPKLFVRYDVVHLHFYVPLGLFVWLYKKLHPKTRVIVTFHGADLLGSRFNGRLKRLWCGISSTVDLAIAVGPEIKSKVDSELRCCESILMPAGVDEKVFFYKDSTEKKFDFIFVGSLVYRKGVDQVIKVIESRSLNEAWCIVGSGDYQAEIVELSKGRNVTYKHSLYQSEIRDLLNASKWLVIPSRKEPFGLVVTESFFCGTPVICSDDYGFRMQVEHEKNGLMVKVNDYDQLLDAVKRVRAMPDSEYAQFAEAARHANKQFSMNAIVDQLLDIYGFSRSEA